MPATARRWPTLLLALVALGSISWAVHRASVGWWFDGELARGMQDISSGRFDAARARFEQLLASGLGDDEVSYHLGLCEEAAGNPRIALEHWGRIDAASPYAALAAERRSRMLRKYHDEGRFAALEDLLELLRGGSGRDAVEAGQSLARLLRFECRFDELRQLLREEWPRSPDPNRTLEELWLLDIDPVPIAMVRGVLDEAAGRSPEDDRVWLGRANLALWSGEFEEAGRWLGRCLERRPEDPAVWRAWLDWAIATERPGEAKRSLGFLTPRVLPPGRALAVRAWLAARVPRSDDATPRHGRELAALDELLAYDPGNLPALERLIELSVATGDPDRAAALRRRKADLDRAHHRYGALLKAGEMGSHLPELATLSEALGRSFEAKAYATLLLKQRPADPDARGLLDRLERRVDEPANPSVPPTPAGLLAEFGGPASPSPPEPPAKDLQAIGSRIMFADEAASAGLGFAFDNGRSPERQLPETMSGGIGLLDADGDGWLDVFVVQGGPFPPPEGSPRSGDRLFRNRGDGTFEDVTRASGIAAFEGGYGHGVAVGDVDNDGHADLFVTRWRGYALYRNNGDGTFSDATEAAGLGGDRDWPTSAAFADLDGDGDLDLYVCHYLAWDAEHPRICPPNQAGDPSYCDPRAFEALPDRLYRNDDGRFVDVTREAGITAPDGRGLGVVAADLDGDGRVDLYVANDTTANFFYRNLGGMRFEEVAHESGLAGNAEGGYQAGMGIALGDLGGDGRPDLAVTNFIGEGTTYYQNLGGGMFIDRTADVGLMAASRRWLGFGLAFLDAENDGRLDLATANGHVNDYRPTFPYAMPAQLLRGGEGGRLTEVSSDAAPVLGEPRVGRGLAIGDLDHDGRVDILIVAQDRPLTFFRNRSDGGRFVSFRLEGTASNRDGVGATVTVRAGGKERSSYRFGGGSYLSASDPSLHFGLGDADRVDEVEVTWPSGQIERHRDLAPDAIYLLREGGAIYAVDLPG